VAGKVTTGLAENNGSLLDGFVKLIKQHLHADCPGLAPSLCNRLISMGLRFTTLEYQQPLLYFIGGSWAGLLGGHNPPYQFDAVYIHELHLPTLITSVYLWISWCLQEHFNRAVSFCTHQISHIPFILCLALDSNRILISVPVLLLE